MDRDEQTDGQIERERDSEIERQIERVTKSYMNLEYDGLNLAIICIHGLVK